MIKLSETFYHITIFLIYISYLPYQYTIFPVIDTSFPSNSEKNIYLCHTLSAHQRDEKAKAVFYFLTE